MYLLKGLVASNQALAPSSLYVELLSRASIILTPGSGYDTYVISIDSVKMKRASIGLDAMADLGSTDGTILYWPRPSSDGEL